MDRDVAALDARTLMFGIATGTQRGVLGVDWDEADLGELESLAQLLQQQHLPQHRFRHLEFSHCLGRSQEVTPVNVYRRMRMRIR